MSSAAARQTSFENWRIALGGTDLAVDHAGLLVIEAEGIVVVADLHLEKGTSLARFGAFLPPYDTRTTLGRLGRALTRLKPRAVVALGDSFHDTKGSERLSAEDRGKLGELQRGRDWIWIAGNHDPRLPADLGGERREEWLLSGLIFRHEPTLGGENEIAGHLHPCARVSRDGHSQRRPCFVYDDNRLLLPAFGAYTGGLNVLDPAIAGLVRGKPNVAVVGRSGVYPVARRQLLGD